MHRDFIITDGPGGDYFVTRFLPSLNKAYKIIHTYIMNVI